MAGAHATSAPPNKSLLTKSTPALQFRHRFKKFSAFLVNYKTQLAFIKLLNCE